MPKDRREYSIETEVALLSQSYASMEKTLGNIQNDLSSVISYISTKKGSEKTIGSMSNIMLTIMTSGGGSILTVGFLKLFGNLH